MNPLRQRGCSNLNKIGHILQIPKFKVEVSNQKFNLRSFKIKIGYKESSFLVKNTFFYIKTSNSAVKTYIFVKNYD